MPPRSATLSSDVRDLAMLEVGWIRELRVDVGEGVEQDAADDPVAVPLVVGGYDEPRCGVRRRPLEHLRGGRLVVGPQLAFVEILGVELPSLGLVVEPRLQAPLLLARRDVQPEL